MNNADFLTYYLTDLATTIDQEHGNRRKVYNVEPWRKQQPLMLVGQTYFATTADIIADVITSAGRVLVWSDQHFSHKNVINYCNRPFPDTESMNQALIDNYNNVVQPNDVVIFCGDVTFGSTTDMNEILDRLPGTKILITGNHDIDRKHRVRSLHVDYQTIALSVNLNGQQLYFTHYPLEVVPEDGINIHGHIHNLVKDSKAHINVSVERTNYQPVEIQTALQTLGI